DRRTLLRRGDAAFVPWPDRGPVAFARRKLPALAGQRPGPGPGRRRLHLGHRARAVRGRHVGRGAPLPVRETGTRLRVRTYVLGLPVDAVSLEEATAWVLAAVRRGKRPEEPGLLVVTLNPEIAVMSRAAHELGSAIRR